MWDVSAVCDVGVQRGDDDDDEEEWRLNFGLFYSVYFFFPKRCPVDARYALQAHLHLQLKAKKHVGICDSLFFSIFSINSLVGKFSV